MMNDTKKIITFLACVVVVMSLLTMWVVKPSQKIGGLVHNVQETFDSGIAVNGTEVISSSRGGSFTSLANIGETTFTGTVSVSQSVSSTLTVGSSTKTGCIALGDSTTSSVVYITASGSTITATTTRPSICR